jgi:CMP-N,N'-diacetyllegionaminic acid synthase
MYNDKKILGLIPARGGSRGLPRKNILPLLGKPLIAWTIEQALASEYLDTIAVSTDDNEIAETARNYGACVPFVRPKELSGDAARTIDALIHAINFFKKQPAAFDYLMLLEPTSPLREKDDIDRCIETLLRHPSAKAIVSVAGLEGAHPEFNVLIDEKGFIRKADGSADFRLLRRQDLKDIFFFEGTVYLSEIEALLAKKTFYHEATLAYRVPRWKSLEVDEITDLICAEALLRNRLANVF